MSGTGSALRGWTWLAVGPLFALALAAQPAAAQSAEAFAPTAIDPGPLMKPVKTRHSGVFGGAKVEYDATAGEVAMSGDAGKPVATIGFTAYIKRGGDPKTRPLIFVFNGGPGASSSPLHLGIGPVRAAPVKGRDEVIANEASPLDVADLIFFDPVGTGYSRIFAAADGKPFWSTTGDADAARTFLRKWLKDNGRLSSPLYLMGESYGGTRATEMIVREAEAELIGETPLNVRGLILLSPAIGLYRSTDVEPEDINPNRSQVLMFPSFAVAAAAQGKAPGGDNPKSVYEAATAFANGPYRQALETFNAMPADQLAPILAKASVFTSLPVEKLRADKLRLYSDGFRDELLADTAQRLGRYDTRMKAPLAKYAEQHPPFDDPSMSAGSADGPFLERYFREALKLKPARAYRTLNLDANMKWSRQPRKGAMDFQTAFAIERQVRVWVGGGYFDLVTPLAASHDAVRKLGLAPGRTEFAGFASGHTVAEDEIARVELARAVRAFVTEPR